MTHTKGTKLHQPYIMIGRAHHAEASMQPNITLIDKIKRIPRPYRVAGVALITLLLAVGAFSLYSSFSNRNDNGGSPLASSSAILSRVMTPKAADLGHSYGIAAGGGMAGLSDKDLNARMAGIEASGAKWVRFDFKWNEIQPDASNRYNWSKYDKLVLAAENHHLFVLGIITYTPQWARPSNCKNDDKCAPADTRQFAKFARALSHRYKDHSLHYWEIWNEPNNPQFWQPAADPAAYARLLKETAKELRAEDSKAYIITGGLSPQPDNDTAKAPVTFLKGVYAAGAKDSFTAVAHHPYTFPLTPTSGEYHAWNQMAASQDSLRSVMTSNGDSGKKIWITEFGAPTGGPGARASVANPNLAARPFVVTEDLQSKNLSDAVALYKSYNWVGPFMYYSYKDSGTTHDTNENFFGLLRADGSKKPAYQVFQDAARNSSVNAQ